MGEMTLEQVREWLAGKERMYVGYQTWATSLNEQEVRAFRAAIDAYDATIQQNAEDAKRLRALERAIERVSSQVTFHTMTNRACIEQFVSAVRGMADEILHEGE